MHALPKRLVALIMAGSLMAAACGDDSSDEGADDTSAPTPTTVADDDGGDSADAGEDPTAAPAAELRAGLTSLLQEHLYLAAITLETAVDAGGDLEDPATVAATDALDENSVALADAVASVAGEDNGEAFLGLWREHIGFFVDYTLGKATEDDAAVEQAMTDLEGYKVASAAFFEDITGGAVSAADVEALVAPHTETTFAAIDALVAGDAETFTLVRAAGQVMPDIAAGLAGAIAAAVPDDFPDDPAGAPAETRATLTHLLQEHVYLAGIALEQAVEAGGDLEDPAVSAAVDALDENSVALSEVVASVSSDEDGEAFLGLWREHIGYFVDYTLGKATEDDAAVEEALTNLSGYQDAAGAFFEEITAGELPADALVGSLEEHVVTVTAAIDALVAGDAEAFSLLRTAAQHMPMSAAALSSAVVAATS